MSRLSHATVTITDRLEWRGARQPTILTMRRTARFGPGCATARSASLKLARSESARITPQRNKEDRNPSPGTCAATVQCLRRYAATSNSPHRHFLLGTDKLHTGRVVEVIRRSLLRCARSGLRRRSLALEDSDLREFPELCGALTGPAEPARDLTATQKSPASGALYSTTDVPDLHVHAAHTAHAAATVAAMAVLFLRQLRHHRISG